MINIVFSTVVVVNLQRLKHHACVMNTEQIKDAFTHGAAGATRFDPVGINATTHHQTTNHCKQRRSATEVRRTCLNFFRFSQRVAMRTNYTHNSSSWAHVVRMMLINNNNNNENNLPLIMFKANRSTLHTVYNMQQSATQGSSDTTHRLSRRTAATTRFSPEGIGCQKQTAPSYLRTIRSGGPLLRKHSPDSATKAR